ncbi:hypothetical protein ACQP10_38305 (plasmid) [Streptosporangium sandarakinum]|uniref:hypothetical protein n=1 Tax=Streptosporangium sandarakinum TaxID=1260955 RepID=UPI003D8A0E00
MRVFDNPGALVGQRVTITTHQGEVYADAYVLDYTDSRGEGLGWLDIMATFEIEPMYTESRRHRVFVADVAGVAPAATDEDYELARRVSRVLWSAPATRTWAPHEVARRMKVDAATARRALEWMAVRFEVAVHGTGRRVRYSRKVWLCPIPETPSTEVGRSLAADLEPFGWWARNSNTGDHSAALRRAGGRPTPGYDGVRLAIWAEQDSKSVKSAWRVSADGTGTPIAFQEAQDLLLGNWADLAPARPSRIASAEPETARVAVLSTSGNFRVHRAGCADLKHLGRSQHAAPFPVAAQTRDAIAAELNQEFIDEGSMTAAEALDYVDFLPCSGLR